MLQLKVVQFTFESLVFASLASVVLLCQDALTTGNTRREMTAAISAVDITKGIKVNYAYNSVILALHSFLGQLNSFLGLSIGGCLLNRLMASIS